MRSGSRRSCGSAESSSSRIIVSGVDRAGASCDVMISVVAVTSERSGREDAERAVEGDERAGEDDQLAGQPDAELREQRDQVLQHRRVDRAARRR